MRTGKRKLVKSLRSNATEAELVIELEGDPHGTPDRVKRDVQWDADLRGDDLKVLRVWNFEVMQEFEAVLETIHRALLRQPLTRTLSHGGERGKNLKRTSPNISSPPARSGSKDESSCRSEISSPLWGEDQGEGSSIL